MTRAVRIIALAGASLIPHLDQSRRRKRTSSVLRQNGPAKGTAHHSVVQVPGTDRWYVAYHRHAIPNGGGYQRETCLARMEFDADGNIKPMDPMIPAFKPGDAGEPAVRR
ncbi:MAG: family 43 glycosylhydrolase [Verrucomicrobiota bacterium]